MVELQLVNTVYNIQGIIATVIVSNAVLNAKLYGFVPPRKIPWLIATL
jgi:hypothetical protein